MKKIALVHLVRSRNGIEPLKRFLDSYLRNPGEIEHELLIIFKGFNSSRELSLYRDVLAGTPYREMSAPDIGFDIGSYMIAFQAFRHEYPYFCFTNSFSEILHPGWLELLYRHASRPEVGLVGATGSYQSISSGAEYPTYSFMKNISPLKSFLVKPFLACLHYYRSRYFMRFPNPHIRTNGFMLPSSVMDTLQVGRMRRKMDAYYFESGRNGLTQQILRMGKKALIVGADGIGYDIPEWYRSNTFWLGDQKNLLISDNQTRAYAQSELIMKIRYSYYAWREDAWPNATALQSEAPPTAL